MPGMKPVTFGMIAGLSLALSGCGGGDDAAKGSPATRTADLQAGQPDAPEPSKAATFNLSSGPDVCFREVARHLGANAKVSEITSFFSSGSDIDSSDDEPKGQMTTCSVHYQNPQDPRKLLATSFDVNKGEFAPPSPVEISVSGGDAAEFKLDDYVVPLASVNAAGLAPIMEAQKAEMAKIYSKYAWSGVRLESPGAFSNVHTLRLDIDGRLASNDIKEGGYASVSIDGRKITQNSLKP